MFKRLPVLILAAFLLLAALPVFAEEPAALTYDEITGLFDSLLERASASQMLHDAEETEEGYALVYDFATIYADRPELTDEAKVYSILFTAENEELIRGTSPFSTLSEVLSAFPCRDASLPGSYTGAVLYLEGSPNEGIRFGYVYRDGQQAETICYEVYAISGAGYDDCGIMYTVSEDMIGAIRVFNLTSALSYEEVRSYFSDMNEDYADTTYRMARISYEGSELEKMNVNDLTFAGFSYLTASESDMPEVLEDMWISNGDGTWLHRIDGDGWYAVFHADGDRKNGELVMFTIMGDAFEGPRYVRVGDSYSSDYNRFRNGDGEFDAESMTEVMYEDENGSGFSVFHDNGSAELRYMVKAEDGRRVQMLLNYSGETMQLTDITVHTLSE
ncbi:MAG: hypothetical protein Q4G19_05350 [Clostridia bacterium]|nr:hypothetical protein [Clostridia bacterium]